MVLNLDFHPLNFQFPTAGFPMTKHLTTWHLFELQVCLDTMDKNLVR
jgi:hypothetical protein